MTDEAIIERINPMGMGSGGCSVCAANGATIIHTLGHMWAIVGLGLSSYVRLKYLGQSLDDVFGDKDAHAEPLADGFLASMPNPQAPDLIQSGERATAGRSEQEYRNPSNRLPILVATLNDNSATVPNSSSTT